MRSFSAWKRRNFYWRETTPLLGSGGFLPPNHLLSPAPLGATAPRPCFAARCAAYRVFSENSQSLFKTFLSFKSTFASFPACFQRSKELSLLPLRNFSVQKYFRAFPCAILAFKSTFIASLARFLRSKVLLSLSRLVFCLQKCFRRFPGVFSAFKNTFTAFPDVFSAFKSTFKTFLAWFRASKELFSFGSNKNQYIKEFLWQK